MTMSVCIKNRMDNRNIPVTVPPMDKEHRTIRSAGEKVRQTLRCSALFAHCLKLCSFGQRIAAHEHRLTLTVPCVLSICIPFALHTVFHTVGKGGGYRLETTQGKAGAAVAGVLLSPLIVAGAAVGAVGAAVYYAGKGVSGAISRLSRRKKERAERRVAEKARTLSPESQSDDAQLHRRMTDPLLARKFGHVRMHTQSAEKALDRWLLLTHSGVLEL